MLVSLLSVAGVLARILVGLLEVLIVALDFLNWHRPRDEDRIKVPPDPPEPMLAAAQRAPAGAAERRDQDPASFEERSGAGQNRQA